MREKQFYVSTDVYRALWLLAKRDKAIRKADPECTESYANKVTPDEIADGILRQYIATNYPQLFAHQKEVDALEKTLIAELKTHEN